MQKVKLTLRIEDSIVQSAKTYAYQYHTTVSKLVAEYLRGLTTQEGSGLEMPILQSLTGILPDDVSLEEHHTYLEEKYGF